VPLEAKAWPLSEVPPRPGEAVSVQISDEALCPRYAGILVRDIPLGPSPDWLRRRLEAIGLRPINNIVDVTNYVLFATAQPIHSFDAAKLSGRRVVVRRAQRGERLRALDGRTVDLAPDMLVIADESRPVGLAGVIGGEESAVTETTRDVFIESAYFDPVSIRLTAKKLGLATDASYRFERGADIGFAPEAARMAASLLCQFGGQATGGLIDVYPKPRKTRPVVLRLRRVSELLGVEIPADFVARVLQALGFRLEESQDGVWRVEVPTFRVDIEREADLIEEIARFYGYDRIPSQMTPLFAYEPPVNRRRERTNRLRQVLFHHGFDEVLNDSFSNPDEEALAKTGRTPIEIRNPISARDSLLRTTLLNGLLETAAWNMNRGVEGVQVFEIGNLYFWQDEKTREVLTLGLLTTGILPASGWKERPRPTDFYVLKGAVEASLGQLRYPISFAEADHPSFDKDQSLAVLYRGEQVGVLGRVAASLAAGSRLEMPVFAAELALGMLLEKQPQPFLYMPVAKFPGVSRDLSFLVGRDVPYQDVKRAVERLSVPFLEGFELRDRFAGPSIPPDKVSLSLRFTYRSPKRTLLAEEVDRVEQNLIENLRAALGAQLREGG
ncbi:MAG: phenylalanine--tRNA ligase subunit beta, partial [Candidatus Aminicenantes bacterium]|nr:phenylalanine--tRNA ligase subunit beta [Candidatus Aminicenantes bacterium]